MNETREEFLERFYADEASTLEELKRLRDLIAEIEKDTYFVFKTRLNTRKNKSLNIKSGGLNVKLEVLTDTSNGRTTQSLTVLDKDGYELSYKSNSSDVKTAKELALLIRIEEDNYDNSATIKAY